MSWYTGLWQAHTLCQTDSSMMSTHQLHLEKHQQHTHHADMIPGVSISYQTALSKSILRLSVNPASALTIFPREPLWSQNHDTGSYDTVYQVDNSNKDVVIYFKSWTMTGIHVVPDRQQYDRRTLITSCRRRYDTWCKYSYQTALSTSIRRLPAHPASALTIHPRKIQALWSNNHDTGSYDT